MCALVLLPLFYGGKQIDSQHLTAVLVWGFAATITALGIFNRKIFRNVRSFQKLEMTLISCSIVFFLISIVHLLPLPVSTISTLSPKTALYYSATETSIGSLALDRWEALSQLLWAMALIVLMFWLLVYPDEIVDRFERIIVASGLICATIALVHWGLQMDVYFGFLGLAPQDNYTRANWPFINPDNLSVVMYIAVVIALGRLLRFWHLDDRQHAPRLTNPRYTSSLLAILVLSLCCVLTLSRAGNALLIIGVLVLLFTWSSFSKNTRVTRLKLIICGLVAIGVAWFTLGSTGQELVSDRIDYAIEKEIRCGTTTDAACLTCDQQRLSLVRYRSRVLVNRRIGIPPGRAIGA